VKQYCSRLGILALALVCLSPARGSTEYALIKANPAAKTLYMNPAWSPDGRSIAYVAITNAEKLDYAIISHPTSIRLATLRNGKWAHKLLVSKGHSPVWSANGTLAFARNGLLIMDLHTGHVKRLSNDRLSRIPREDDATAYQDIPISFSPDGRYLAYNRLLWEEAEIRVFDMKLNRDLGINVGNRFAWSRDSRRMLTSFEWYGDQQVPSRLVMWDLSRAKWRSILKGYRVDDIVWPKGRDYAWVLIQDVLDEGPDTDLKPPNGAGIYRLDLTKHTLTKLSDITSWILPSPTYERFAFAGKRPDATGEREIYVGETGKWQFRLIARHFPGPGNWSQRARFMGWSPDGKSLAYVTGQGDIRIVKFP